MREGSPPRTFHVSHVTCHVSYSTWHLKKNLFYQVMKLVCGGSVNNGATVSSFLTSKFQIDLKLHDWFKRYIDAE